MECICLWNRLVFQTLKAKECIQSNQKAGSEVEMSTVQDWTIDFVLISVGGNAHAYGTSWRAKRIPFRIWVRFVTYTRVNFVTFTPPQPVKYKWLMSHLQILKSTQLIKQILKGVCFYKLIETWIKEIRENKGKLTWIMKCKNVA